MPTPRIGIACTTGCCCLSGVEGIFQAGFEIHVSCSQGRDEHTTRLSELSLKIRHLPIPTENGDAFAMSQVQITPQSGELIEKPVMQRERMFALSEGQKQMSQHVFVDREARGPVVWVGTVQDELLQEDIDHVSPADPLVRGVEIRVSVREGHFEAETRVELGAHLVQVVFLRVEDEFVTYPRIGDPVHDRPVVPGQLQMAWTIAWSKLKVILHGGFKPPAGDGAKFVPSTGRVAEVTHPLPFLGGQKRLEHFGD